MTATTTQVIEQARALVASQECGHAELQVSDPLTAYRGALWGHEETRTHLWWAPMEASRGSSFGEVREGELEISDALVIDADVVDLGWGLDAEEIMKEMLDESRCDMVVLLEWEGPGDVAFYLNPKGRATVRVAGEEIEVA